MCRSSPLLLWSAIDFKIRKFPQMRVHNSGRPLLNEKFSVALDDEGKKRRAVAASRLPRFGNSSDAVFFERDAEFFDRTNQALRIARRANQRAEFHQRLVEMGAEFVLGARAPSSSNSMWAAEYWHRAMNQFFRQLPEPRVGFLFLRIFRDAKNSGQNADDIAIENRRGLVEGDAANRAGGVTADARQCENVVKVFGKFVGDDVRSL